MNKLQRPIKKLAARFLGLTDSWTEMELVAHHSKPHMSRTAGPLLMLVYQEISTEPEVSTPVYQFGWIKYLGHCLEAPKMLTQFLFTTDHCCLGYDNFETHAPLK